MISGSATRRALLALTALAVLAFPLTASAKSPKSGERPSVEQLLQKHTKAKADAEAAAIEASRDPHRETIEGYKDGTTPLADYEALMELIANEKDDKMRKYRRPAATALMERFIKAGADGDDRVRELRAAAVLEILHLMKSSKKETLSLAIIHDILSEFWKRKMSDYNFKATKELKDRRKAYNSMKKYLQGQER